MESLPRLIENKSLVMSAYWADSGEESGGASTPLVDRHPVLGQLCDALCHFVNDKTLFHRIVHHPVNAQQQQQQPQQQATVGLEGRLKFTRSDFHVKVKNHCKLTKRAT